MHGHAPMAPPRPGPSAGVIVVRVILCLVVVLSLGSLAWIAMLRIAIMRRRGRDWALFWGQLVLNIACLATLEQRLADHWISNVGMAGLLVQMAAVTAYYLVADIRHHQPPAVLPWAPPPPQMSPQMPPQMPPYGYGYPPPQPPPPTTLPPTTPPPGPRIDQVRAELDELSHLLRKDPREGGR
ncbi:hypothetical protein [Streptomyces vilmorinianum]|uniref:hypothetical protein n=1 Tax=Streptomyces vilmorinianum TaxID=3051092 RepID=UPI0010FB25EF|nr:hypothetical protein [Streptomyces vilmorinianum]